MIEIVPAQAADLPDIEALLDAAFGQDRKARTAYAIRGAAKPLEGFSFVARSSAGQILGSIQLWPITLREAAGQVHPLLLLGPVAVAPQLQRSGIGKQLMARALEETDAAAIDAIVLIGDPEYYERFGFFAAPTAQWETPGPVERHRLLVRLQPKGAARLPARGTLGPAS